MLERWDNLCHHWVEELLEQGSDDQVFASGYLQGHFAVVLSELEGEPDIQWSALEGKMTERLEQAKGELAPPDLVLVQGAWQQLSERLQATA